jgi:uncharacterized protein YbgA (DUF1722 family)
MTDRTNAMTEADEFHRNAQAIIAAMQQRGVKTIGELVAAVAQEQEDGDRA